MSLQHRTGWPLLLGRNDSGKVPGEKKSPLPRRIPSASLMLPSERPGRSALLTHGLSSAHSYSDHHDATVPPPCRPFVVLAGPEGAGRRVLALAAPGFGAAVGQTMTSPPVAAHCAVIPNARQRVVKGVSRAGLSRPARMILDRPRQPDMVHKLRPLRVIQINDWPKLSL